MSILEVNHIKKVYKTRMGGEAVTALRDVHFSVEPGEFVAIMGESGSGKTTLLNILASLDTPTAGKVLVDGKDFTTLKDNERAIFRRSNLGFIFQDFNLLDNFSIEDNIKLPLVLAGEDYKKMDAKVEKAAGQLGIVGLLKKYPYEVSGGQKQRTAIARALITNPRILLADEAANDLKKPGMPCYEPVIATLGRQILQEDGTINNKKMAEAIFASSEKLAQINAIIHPAVRTYIMEQIRLERESGVNDFFFLEAALLIEEHYDEVLDELWYVYANEQVRYKRLKDSRGYSDEKTASIISRQQPDAVFRSKCDFVLDNSGDFENTKQQIDEKLGVYLCKEQTASSIS